MSYRITSLSPPPICCVVISILRKSPLDGKVHFWSKRPQAILSKTGRCEEEWTGDRRQSGGTCSERSPPMLMAGFEGHSFPAHFLMQPPVKGNLGAGSLCFWISETKFKIEVLWEDTWEGQYGHRERIQIFKPNRENPGPPLSSAVTVDQPHLLPLPVSLSAIWQKPPPLRAVARLRWGMQSREDTGDKQQGALSSSKLSFLAEETAFQGNEPISPRHTYARGWELDNGHQGLLLPPGHFYRAFLKCRVPY